MVTLENLVLAGVFGMFEYFPHGITWKPVTLMGHINKLFVLNWPIFTLFIIILQENHCIETTFMNICQVILGFVTTSLCIRST